LSDIVTLNSGFDFTQDYSNRYTVQKPGCGFLLGFHSYGSILHHLLDKARCWSKIVIISYPLHSTPPLGGFPSEYCHPVWLVWEN